MLRVLALLVIFAAAHVWGQVVPPEVTAAQLDAAAVRVTSTLSEEDPRRKALLKTYEETRAALSNYEKYEQDFRSYALARANAEGEVAAIQQALAETSASPAAQVQDFASVSLAELDQMFQVTQTELAAKKGQLADMRHALDVMPGRPAEIRARVTRLVDLSSELESRLALMTSPVESGSQEEAARWLLQAQAASFGMEKAALDEEQLSQPMRLNLLKAKLDRTSNEISLLERRSQAMTAQAGELRKEEVAQAREVAALVLAGMNGKHALVKQLADSNADLTNSFIDHSTAIVEVRDHEVESRRKAEEVENDLKSIARRLELLGMSTAMGHILREQNALLPERRDSAREIINNSRKITSSSLRQLELEDERRKLSDPTEYVRQLVEGESPQVVELVSDDLYELARNRSELVRQAIELEDTYAQALGDLDYAMRRHALAVTQYRDFISQRLLWIPSRDTFTLFHGAGLVHQVKDVFTPDRWLAMLRDRPAQLLAQPEIGLAILLVCLLIYFGPRLLRLLQETGKYVGYVRSDYYYYTFQAVGLTLLLSAKWPMLLLCTAWLFDTQESESELAAALFDSSLRTAFYFSGWEFLRIALVPKGLVDSHFRWPIKLVSLIRHRVTALEWVFLPSAFFVLLFTDLYPIEVGGALGALAVILVLSSIAYFFRRFPAFAQSKVQRMFGAAEVREITFLGALVRNLLFWVPLAGIVAVTLGYTFAAIEIILLLTRTFMFVSCLLIFNELGLRWLTLTQRRMALKLREEHTRSSNEEGEVTIEEELLENDPELLSDEGAKLLNLFTLIGGLLGIALIWLQVFPAMGILDSVDLWYQTTVVDGVEVSAPVSLGDLLGTLAIAIIGWVALRRIPGLLEIWLRQSVGLPAASAYASTRVFQYAATTLLVVFVVSSLGGRWSSMQWAVAALSLGIGFGLQEIVANFICGLIILFEQPIRLGDVVTVGEISGRVTRIQMRATTIRDFDNRELLVPNKEFVTSKLLNWSLSDTVTRREVQVGVAYGTDIDKAMDIVSDVARQHPVVLSDPESMITFDEFGDNSLLISLRYFMANLDMRRKVDSDLRLEINRRFNEAGIVVAFPQRDVHLDARQPLEIKMVAGELGSPGPGPGPLGTA